MKRYCVAGLALLVLAVPAAALASHQGGDEGGPYDFATGAGRVLGPDQFFNLSAHDGPQGVHGEMTLDKGDVRVKADVNCLAVQNNVAAIEGTVGKSDDPLLPAGSKLTFYVEDNGEPGQGTDRFTAHGRPFCHDSRASISARTLIQGNVVVHDAP